MGDSCEIAYYESETDDLFEYKLLFYHSRGGAPFDAIPRLATCLLDLHFKRHYSSGSLLNSTESIMDFLCARLVDDFKYELYLRTPKGGAADQFTWDSLYAIYDTTRIDLYSIFSPVYFNESMIDLYRKENDIMFPNGRGWLSPCYSVNILKLFRSQKIPGW